MKFRNKLNSIFSKIFISYITILVLVVISNIFVYSCIKNIIIKKEVDADIDYLNYTSKIVDNELLHLKKSIYTFLQSPQNIKKIQNINSINNQNDIIKELLQFKSNNKIVNTCLVYNANIKNLFTSDGSINKSSFFTNTFNYKNISINNITNIIKTTNTFNYIPTHKVSVNVNDQPNNPKEIKNIITLLAGVSYSNNPNKLVVTIDESDIRPIITDSNTIKHGDIYIVNDDGIIISSSNEDKITQNIDKNILTLVINSSQTINKKNLNNNLIVSKKSEFTNWYYITVIPYKNIFKSMSKVKMIFMYVLIIFIFIGILTAFIFSKIYYNPIAKLISKFSLNGNKNYKDEFAQISDIVGNMHVKNKSMEQNKILLKILKTGIIDNDFENIFRYKNFQVVVIKSTSLYNILEQIKDFINSNAKDNISFTVVNENEQQCCIIINYDYIIHKNIIDYLINLKHHIEVQKGVLLIIGVSNICSNFNNLYSSYQNALLAIRHGNSMNETCLYEYSEDLVQKTNIYFPVDFESNIYNHIYNGNEENINNLIDKIFKKNQGIPNLYMKNIISEFINIFVKLANNINCEINITNVNKTLENEYRISYLKTFIKKLYKKLITENVTQNDKAKQVENYIVNYINANYTNSNITIEEIAENLNLSSAYVSTLFKKSKGIPFSQYLVIFRINKAKQLLDNTDYKVKDISEKVGFGTYNNFCRAFKKKIGVTPSKYREM